MTTWTEHVARWRNCQLCPLAQQRGNIVLARAGVVGGITTGGQLPCDVCFVGEAPGASEDAIGLPFVGPAGDLLQQIIKRALPVGTSYALTNLVACFPAEAKASGFNEPERGEILACRPRLVDFIAMAQPKLLVLVGTLAAEYARGPENGIPRVEIVHPAHILARLPLAQKQMAVQKSIVVIRSAYEDIMEVRTTCQEDQRR